MNRLIAVSNNNLRKSQSDKRAYRYIKLANQMKCLLVEDRETQKAAATLHVQSGSLNDPLDCDGLAHFCEHMLFLGTRKYPSENYYSEFIKRHGGEKNASTAEDYTNYYFDVKNEVFCESLDIFSQFFKEPLFTESATEREMQAVDSEFR